jgi:NADH-quinone oxidoreductase subunit H
MQELFFLLINLIKFINVLLTVLLMVAFFTVKERKIISFTQRRKGPAIVGFAGTLQAVADGLKLLLKGASQPTNADKALYIFCPVFAFSLSLMSWSVIPFGFNLNYVEIKFNLLFLLAVSSLNVYTIILSGWSSNSRYALLGALRAAAQMISYELSFSVIIMSIIICSGSLNLFSIVAAQSYNWFCVQHFPVFLMFLFTIIAETNRLPFDFAEAESELVSGFNVEYSGMSFALFFLAEYSNMIVMSVITSLMFLGGWGIPFLTDKIPYIMHPLVLGVKTLIVMSFFVIIRTTLPRYKYDLLMNLGWKTFLPLSLSWFLSTVFVLLIFDGLPAFGGFNPKFPYFDAGSLFLEDFYINPESNLKIPEICLQQEYLIKIY